MDQQYHFQEQLEFDGEHYDLVYDPGNPQRPQVVPNYQRMFPQDTSAILDFELPGLGRRWLAIVDAVTPAQSMQQTGGLPDVERRYLCFRLYDNEASLPRATRRVGADGKLEYVPSALAVPPQEMVIYARRAAGSGQGNRAQRLIGALLGAAAREMPAPNPDWTREFARIARAGASAAAEPPAPTAADEEPGDHAR